MSRTIARLTIAALVAPAALAATTNGAAVDMTRFTGAARVHLNASAMGGSASPTDTVKLQHSADGTTWADVPNGAFAPITSAGPSVQDILVNTDSLRKFVRVVDTLAGTSPTVTRSVSIVGTLAY